MRRGQAVDQTETGLLVPLACFGAVERMLLRRGDKRALDFIRRRGGNKFLQQRRGGGGIGRGRRGAEEIAKLVSFMLLGLAKEGSVAAVDGGQIRLEKRERLIPPLTVGIQK